MTETSEKERDGEPNVGKTAKKDGGTCEISSRGWDRCALIVRWRETNMCHACQYLGG